MKVHVRVVGCDDEFGTVVETESEGLAALQVVARASGKGCVPQVMVHKDGEKPADQWCDICDAKKPMPFAKQEEASSD